MKAESPKTYAKPGSNGIKAWSAEDRPREKLLNTSNKSLSNVELLAMVIGSGSADQSAVELARTILASVSDNLAELGRLSVPDLIKFKGIGTAKASNIVAVMELGRRRRMAEGIRRRKVHSSRVAFEIMQPIIGELPHEEFWLIALRNNNAFHRKICVSEGGVSATIADPKKIFRLAVENNASALVLCHNHPSGQISPSRSDILLTRKCREAGKVLDMPVVDHLIIASDTYFSFADEGRL